MIGPPVFFLSSFTILLVGLLGGCFAGRAFLRFRLAAACRHFTDINKFNDPWVATGARWAMAEVYSWCINEVPWLSDSRKKLSDAPGSRYKEALEAIERARDHDI